MCLSLSPFICAFSSRTCNITLGSLAICEMSCSLFFFFQVLNMCFDIIHSGHSFLNNQEVFVFMFLCICICQFLNLWSQKAFQTLNFTCTFKSLQSYNFYRVSIIIFYFIVFFHIYIFNPFRFYPDIGYQVCIQVNLFLISYPVLSTAFIKLSQLYCFKIPF